MVEHKNFNGLNWRFRFRHERLVHDHRQRAGHPKEYCRDYFLQRLSGDCFDNRLLRAILALFRQTKIIGSQPLRNITQLSHF